MGGLVPRRERIAGTQPTVTSPLTGTTLRILELIKVTAAPSRKVRETRCLRFDQCRNATSAKNRSSEYTVLDSGVIILSLEYY